MERQISIIQPIIVLRNYLLRRYWDARWFISFWRSRDVLDDLAVEACQWLKDGDDLYHRNGGHYRKVCGQMHRIVDSHSELLDFYDSDALLEKIMDTHKEAWEKLSKL